MVLIPRFSHFSKKRKCKENNPKQTKNRQQFHGITKYYVMEYLNCSKEHFRRKNNNIQIQTEFKKSLN